MGRRTSAAGFTLVEVLVGLAVAAVFLPVLFGIFQSGLRGAGQVAGSDMAILLAESKLATVGVESAIEEGRRSGRFANGFSWEVFVRPFRPDPDRTQGDVYRLWEVTIVVRHDDRPDARSVSLTTLRLGGRV